MPPSAILQGLTGNNGLFSLESHSLFNYTPGQYFYINSANPLLVFVGGQLAYDGFSLGAAGFANVSLGSLGAVAGQAVNLDLFMVNSNPSASTLYIQTNIDAFLPFTYPSPAPVTAPTNITANVTLNASVKDLGVGNALLALAGAVPLDLGANVTLSAFGKPVLSASAGVNASLVPAFNALFSDASSASGNASDRVLEPLTLGSSDNATFTLAQPSFFPINGVLLGLVRL